MILPLEPVLGQLPGSLHLPVWLDCEEKGRLSPDGFSAVCRAALDSGLPPPVAVPAPAHVTAFEQVIADYLIWALAENRSAASGTGQAIPAYAQARRIYRGWDGASISALVRGKGARRILFFGAPGLPSELTGGWIEGLAGAASVAVVETRAIMNIDAAGDADLSVAAQIGDAGMLLGQLGWDEVDVVGVCGGAALALAFAQKNSAITRSLSLWFGDYELGSAAPKTEHQQNLQSLMAMVADGLASATDVLSMLFGLLSRGLPPALAPFCLFPFARAETFARYCRMNSAVMSLDCQAAAAGLAGPSQVGYSLSDQTAHPKGSEFVGQVLNARLEQLDGVSHLDGVFGRPEDVALVQAFHAGLGQSQPMDPHRFGREAAA